jgi:hypothetical protein
MKTNLATLELPQAFLHLSGNIILDAKSQLAIATDGEAMITHPLPNEFGLLESRTVTVTEDVLPITAASGEPADGEFDFEALENPPAYRIALNAAKLALLAEAMQNNVVILELPAEPAGKPIKIHPWSGCKTAYLMPSPMLERVAEGLLVNPGTAAEVTGIQSPAAAAPLPAPVVTACAERHTLEIFFGGKPDAAIREALKDPGLAFRYSGRGTRRGVPPHTWYGPDNPYTREKISALLGVGITNQAA